MTILIVVGAVLIGSLALVLVSVWMFSRTRKFTPEPLLGVYTPEDYDAQDR